MGTVTAITVGLVLWIVLWAIGSKAFDAFLLTLAIAIVAATARIVAGYIPGNRNR